MRASVVCIHRIYIKQSDEKKNGYCMVVVMKLMGHSGDELVVVAENGCLSLIIHSIRDDGWRKDHTRA